MSTKLPPLYRAVIAGDVDRVKALLTKKWYRGAVDINGADTNCGYSPLHRAIEARNRRMIRLLLRHNPPADANWCFGGHSPLDEAMRWGDPEVIKWLTDAGGKTYHQLQQPPAPELQEVNEVTHAPEKPSWVTS